MAHQSTLKFSPLHLHHRITNFIIALLSITVLLSSSLIVNNSYQQQQSLGQDAIHLSQIQVLTFRKGQLTNYRRNSPVQQLSCKSSLDGYTPDVVQCKNQGFDSQSYQWKCEADMDEKYRFGDYVNVICEGYRYPGDQYVLEGSCGLEYALELTEKGKQQYHHNTNYQHRQQQPHYQQHHHETHTPSNPNNLGPFVIVVVSLAVFAFIWLTGFCRGDNNTTRNIPPSSSTSSIYPGLHQATTNEDIYNPNYTPQQEYSTPYPQQTTTSSSGFGTIPTFVAGAATGYAAASLLNNNTNQRQTRNSGSYFNDDYNYTTPSSYNNSSFFSSSQTQSHDDSPSKTTTRKTTGYASTTSR